MKAVTGSALLLLAGCSASEATQTEDDPVDWVEVKEGIQAAHSYDYLLNCWADQWPDRVKGAEGPAPATADEIKTAIRRTREHCQLEIWVRLDQIEVDLARRGMEPAEIEKAAERQLETDLDGMFDEYWSRL